jgi:hypothetical protein
MTTASMVTPSGKVSSNASTSRKPKARQSGTPGNVAIKSSCWNPSKLAASRPAARIARPSPCPRPIGTDKHRPNVCGIRGWVEEAIACWSPEPVYSRPRRLYTPAHHDLAVDVVNEVGAVADQRRVDVGDVHRCADGLALVVEPAVQLEYRHPHHCRDLVDIGGSGDMQDRIGVAHAGRPRDAPSPNTTSALPADIT